MDDQSKLTLFSTFNNSILICHEKEKKLLNNRLITGCVVIRMPTTHTVSLLITLRQDPHLLQRNRNSLIQKPTSATSFSRIFFKT